MPDLAWQKETMGDNFSFDARKEDFESFFRLFYSDLCNFVYAFVKDRDEAKDIVQSVFIKVWEQKNFWDDFNSAKTYLYKSVRNEALNYKKHQRVKQEAYAEVKLRFSEWARSYKSDTTEDRKIEIIQEGVETLPGRCREIFKLSRESGLTYNEIAGVLGISEKTVETQMGRAFKTLRSFVNEHWSEGIVLLVFLFS